MNMTEKQAEQFGLKQSLNLSETMIEEKIGRPLISLYSHDTYQFSDYEKYESSMFSEEAKAKRQKAEQFPIDCQKAFEMGIALATVG